MGQPCLPHSVSDILTRPEIALFSFRTLPETDNAPMAIVSPTSTTSHPSDSNPSQPSAPTIQSYLLPHSQGVPQPSFSGKPYVPSKSVQKLTQYPSEGVGGTGEMSGRSISQISSPTMDRMLDDDGDGASEKWSDRFSFVAKDSYGNLRCGLLPPVPSSRCC